MRNIRWQIVNQMTSSAMIVIGLHGEQQTANLGEDLGRPRSVFRVHCEQMLHQTRCAVESTTEYTPGTEA